MLVHVLLNLAPSVWTEVAKVAAADINRLDPPVFSHDQIKECFPKLDNSIGATIKKRLFRQQLSTTAAVPLDIAGQIVIAWIKKLELSAEVGATVGKRGVALFL